MCCFCKEIDDHANLRAAGTLHATSTKTNISHVESTTQKWLEMAQTLHDDEMIRILSAGDVVSNKTFYHKEEVKCCLAAYHKRYQRCIKENENNEEATTRNVLTEMTSFNKLKQYIISKEKDEPGTVFVVKTLEQLYLENLRNFGIEKQSHVSRFGKRLCQEINGLELRNVAKKLTVYFNDMANTLI